MTDEQMAWLVAAVVHAGQVAACGAAAGNYWNSSPDDQTVEEVQMLAVKFHAALTDKWLEEETVRAGARS